MLVKAEQRVAVLTTSYPEFDGDPSGHFVQAEVRAWEAERADVRVIAGRGSAFGWPGLSARIRERPWRVLSALGWAIRAMGKLRRLDMDHAIAHWAVPCGYPIATVGLRKRVTLELVSHGADVRLLVALPAVVRERIVNQLVDRASCWRFVSSSLLESLCASLATATALKVKRIARVQASPIEMPEMPTRDVRDGFARGEYAVSVGRLIASKQVDVCIDWAAKHGVPLAVVGDGPEEPSLRRAAAKSGARVVWLGRLARPEALAWIHDARALVVASRDEGLSTVVREAAHFGTEVIDLSQQPRRPETPQA